MLVDQPLPAWVWPALLLLIGLVLGAAIAVGLAELGRRK
jgi:hypothetical protein